MNARLQIPLENHIIIFIFKYGVIEHILTTSLIVLSYLEPPNSPENLTIVSVTSRTARISWSISRAEPKIERFVVQWKKQHGNLSHFILY